jgi:hypothetical protein
VRVAWTVVLWVVNPAGAYMRRQERRRGYSDGRGGRGRPRRRFAAYGDRPFRVQIQAVAPDMDPAQREELIRAHRERQEAAERAFAGDAERTAGQLLATGHAVVSSSQHEDHGSIELRLVRFWNGTGVLDSVRLDPAGRVSSSSSLLDRRDMRTLTVENLARRVVTSIAHLRSGPPGP